MTTAALPEAPLFSFEIPTPRREQPSLSEKAMLCSVSISAWSGYSYDREASEQIATIHGAETDAGRFNKRLIPRKELEEITRIIGQTRRDHEFVTLPWSDNGLRVLPGAAYMDHRATMRLRQDEFNSAVGRLLDRFEKLVKAQSRLGTLFKVADYPGMRDDGGALRFASPDELRNRFSFVTSVFPLSDADDFRVSIGDEERERVKRQISDSIQAALRVGTRELWQRLYKAVSHMSERMNEYNNAGDGKRPRLYDSMITNIVEIVDVLPKLNIAGDGELERMTEEVRQSLLVDPQQLRKSPTLRSDAGKAAADIAQRMAAYMGIPVSLQIGVVTEHSEAA